MDEFDVPAFVTVEFFGGPWDGEQREMPLETVALDIEPYPETHFTNALKAIQHGDDHDMYHRQFEPNRDGTVRFFWECKPRRR